jgi:hypothetical protein
MSKHRNFLSKTIVLAASVAAGVALLSSGDVEAGLVTHISGTICKPASSGSSDRTAISYSSWSAANTSSGTKAVICGLPMKYSIGKTLEYDFNVIDKSTTGSVSCSVVALNTSNNVIYASAETPSGAAFTGYKRMPVASTAFASEDATQRHYAVCTLPGATSASNTSSVLGIRLY